MLVVDFVSDPLSPAPVESQRLLLDESKSSAKLRTRLSQARDTGEGERPWILFGLRGVGTGRSSQPAGTRSQRTEACLHQGRSLVL